MTDLTIPRDANEEDAEKLVREHVEIGDTVQIWERERTDDGDHDVVGEVTGIEAGYLELDGQSPESGSVRYDEIDTVIRVEDA
ncbi:hypothetical protein [Natronolimnohabitans innermongolicus]|uniref:Uncharacterized protein n=1 Tax=Natronolimnohabitans innermongolicus JCM 12255 TaxID=1227499 RepID=L9WLV7_9EURY|nr:hypothetical protein [Natronolimnohabitans innermongolicus]ELY49333.1 hypothetical protein C493_20721 [Natronolimnohabitans innermongolicus JCM 12255]